MSRCFPFPPPGYEKKPRTDDADLLKKEKRKEKKHKKDRKDKDKKERKEKREKDRSERKHKEKRDKKDKHRDKKDKENGKDKEKVNNHTSDENRTVDGQIEGHNGEKLHHSNEQNKQKSSSSASMQFQNGQYNELLHRKGEFSKEKCSSSYNNKSSIQYCGQNGDLGVQNKINMEENENFKFVQELGRRIRNEEKGTGSHQYVVDSRKESVNRVESSNFNGLQIKNEEIFGEIPMVQKRIDGTTPTLETNRRIEEKEKEKMREKESDDKRGDKRKNKDRDKQRQGKDKDKAKDKKEEKAKEKVESKKANRDKNKHIKKIDVASLDNLSTRPPNINVQGVGIEVKKRTDMEATRNISVQGVGIEVKKRKDMEANGFSHENEPRPNKMARSASNIFTENGRKLDFLQKPGLPPDKQQEASLNGKELKINGIIANQKPPIVTSNHIASKPTSTKSPPLITNNIVSQSSAPNHIAAQSSTVPPRKPSSTVINEAPRKPLSISKKKPPHPDTKYLNQILEVPKLDQWSDFDDQEWLFRSKEKPHFKKTTMEDSFQDQRELQVWSEAKHIESVDVCALPYVIPY